VEIMGQFAYGHVPVEDVAILIPKKKPTECALHIPHNKGPTAVGVV